MSIELHAKILKSASLPTLPNVALEVLRLTRSADISVDALAKVIQNDPALSCKLLKVVNSALFGMSREIGSIRQAMVILGLRSVKVMALSFSVIEAFGQREVNGFHIMDFWKRSIFTAVAARLLAKQIAPKVAEEAFVAGLLADIGMFAAWRCVPEVYEPVHAKAKSSGAPLWSVEAEAFGASHAAMSAELLRTWNVPESICQAVAGHHGETPATGSVGICDVVQAAAGLAEVFCQEIPARELEAVTQRCVALTGIDQASVDEALTKLHEYVQETASLLSLKIDGLASYAEVQAAAAAQLAELSVEAELEKRGALDREREARNEAEMLLAERSAILEIASTDALTRVANRAAFDRRLAEESEQAAANKQQLGLIMVDVDHFKRVNDAYGHPAGDSVLQWIAAKMKETAQQAGFVARYGGEEFAVIVRQHAARQIERLAEEIRQRIEGGTVSHNGIPLKITVSLGAAVSRGGAICPKALIESADQRLYEAKRAGRNRVVWRAEDRVPASAAGRA